MFYLPVTTVVYRTSDNRPRIVALIHPLNHCTSIIISCTAQKEAGQLASEAANLKDSIMAVNGVVPRGVNDLQSHSESAGVGSSVENGPVA